MSKSHQFGHPSWVREREFRQRFPLGHSDAFCKGLYSSIWRCDFRETPEPAPGGGIYSMDFSPDGSMLVTNWNSYGFQILDPLRQNVIERNGNAHEGWVKKVKFLDSRTFATGSADLTLALWDVRNLTENVLSLQGHGNTVCNIEFSSANKTLVTCGGDGRIHSWNLNDSTEEDIECEDVYGSYDFLRMRLSPDASKMVISSARGYMLIVHDLDMDTLGEDLDGYCPGACPLIHLQRRIRCGPADVYALSRRRNRVEPVTDFPVEDACTVVSALEVHPEGVSVLSRSSHPDEALQWLSVHDIRDRERARGEDEVTGSVDAGSDGAMGWEGATPPEPEGQGEEQQGAEGSSEQDESSMMSFLRSFAAMSLSPGESSREASGQMAEGEGDRRHLEDEGEGEAAAAVLVLESPPLLLENIGCPVDSSSPKSEQLNSPGLPRLTHYAESKNTGMLCSEELSFSPDGRLMCSPYGAGVMLHTFSPKCSGQFVSWPGEEAIPLHELATHIYHNSVVVSTRFSPRHCLIVSGCLRGKINWYQPVLK